MLRKSCQAGWLIDIAALTKVRAWTEGLGWIRHWFTLHRTVHVPMRALHHMHRCAYRLIYMAAAGACCSGMVQPRVEGHVAPSSSGAQAISDAIIDAGV